LINWFTLIREESAEKVTKKLKVFYEERKRICWKSKF